MSENKTQQICLWGFTPCHLPDLVMKYLSSKSKRLQDSRSKSR